MAKCECGVHKVDEPRQQQQQITTAAAKTRQQQASMTTAANKHIDRSLPGDGGYDIYINFENNSNAFECLENTNARN